MSLRKNIIANYASQLYVTGVGILILPLYIKYMGAEAYGLVGFFTMLQAWFSLLDMGLTPTIGRETARYHGGAISALTYRKLYRALSLIFIVIALVGGGGLWLFSDVVATQWLQIKHLNTIEVVITVQIMAISVAMRWMGGLYRGVISGSERLIWLSAFNSFIATLRFIVVFFSMWVYGFTPSVFFIHQLIVAMLELFGLWMMGNRLLPVIGAEEGVIGWSFHSIRPVLKFSLSIAFTSSVWVMVTQTDKLVLSGILPLSEYGYFTLAVLVASGIMVISGPISSAIMPRMARLYAEGQHDELIQVYRNATQLVTVIAGSASITIAFCAKPLLYAWTGNHELAIQAASILRLYAIGNGFLVVAAFPYYLQYAMGNLRYHLIGNAVMIVVLLPTIITAARYFGGVGAGYVWLGLNGTFLLFWVGYIHHKLVPGLHRDWIMKDIIGICFPVIIVLSFIFYIDIDVSTRSLSLIYIFGVSSIALTIGGIMSTYVRERVFSYMKKV